MSARPRRPAYPNVNPDAIPADLRNCPHWVAWRWEWRVDKWTKIPVNPLTGRNARVNAPETWDTFDFAMLYARRHKIGVGYIFSADDPFAGVDFDKCRDPETGEIDLDTLVCIRVLASYSDISPSDTGIKVIVRATLPPGGRRKGSIEMYDRGRLFTITGRLLPGAPPTIEDRQEVLGALHHSIFGEKHRTALAAAPRPIAGLTRSDQDVLDRLLQDDKARRLWEGDTSDYRDDSEDGANLSSADLALCNKLRFYTGADPVQMDRLFRQSELMRPKWDKPARSGETYGGGTIRTALPGEVWTPPVSTPVRPEVDARDQPAPSSVGSRTFPLAERGDLSAPPGSTAWAVAMRLEIAGLLSDNQSSAEHLRIMATAMEEHAGYSKLDGPDGYPFATFEAFCTAPAPWGLGYDPAMVKRIIQAARAERDRPTRSLPQKVAEGSESRPSATADIPAGMTCGAALAAAQARLAELETQLAAERQQRVAAEAESHRLNERLSLVFQVQRHKPIKQQAPVFLAAVNEIASAQSRGLAEPDGWVSTYRAAIAERAGCGEKTVTDHLEVIADDLHLLDRRTVYRDRERVDQATGEAAVERIKVLQVRIPPNLGDVNASLRAAVSAERPEQPKWGGFRTPCPECGGSEFVIHQTTACADCGTIVDTRVTRRRIADTATDNADQPVKGQEDLLVDSPPHVVNTSLEGSSWTFTPSTPPPSGQQPCGVCRRPLRNDAERAAGCHDYDCAAPLDDPPRQLHPPNVVPIWPAAGDD